MGFINLNLGDVKEQRAVAAGRYRLVIANWEETESKEKKTPQLKFSINIEGHDEAMQVQQYIPLAGPKDEQKSAAFKNLLMARFLTLFKVPNTVEGFNPDDAIGCSADAELQLTEPNKDSGDVFNRLVVPKLSGEAEEAKPVKAVVKKR